MFVKRMLLAGGSILREDELSKISDRGVSLRNVHLERQCIQCALPIAIVLIISAVEISVLFFSELYVFK